MVEFIEFQDDDVNIILNTANIYTVREFADSDTLRLETTKGDFYYLKMTLKEFKVMSKIMTNKDGQKI